MRLNYSMTAEEKTNLARFLDLAAGQVQGGYVERRDEYGFQDDTDGPSDGHPNGIPVEVAAEHDSLDRLGADVGSCTGCRLKDTRKNAVPGEGVSRPLVMVVGEGPGADEDASGRPFVGKAGQLLDRMLAAIDLSREKNCYIANVIKCRPPGNRDPFPDETIACASFLERQVRLLKPAFILCAGRVAAQTLLDTTDSIGKLRGQIMNLNIAGMTIPFVATYHPSALLRNEAWKRPAWEDLKLLRSALAEAGLDPANPGTD